MNRLRGVYLLDHLRAALALLALGLLSGAAQDGPEGLARFRTALDARQPEAFELYSGADIGARRAMAAAAVGSAGPEHLASILATFAGERDGEARASWVRALGNLLPLEPEAAAQRADALGSLALEDADPGVRSAALEALGTADGTEAAQQLSELLGLLPPAEVGAAARALAACRAGGEVIVARVLAAAAREPGPVRAADALGAEAQAILLPAYGRALADPARGPLTARERAPIVRALRDPTPALRRAGDAALGALVGRLLALREPARAERLLADLAGEGAGVERIELWRARLLLGESLSAEDALAAARARTRSATAGGRADAAEIRVGARHLEGLALLALDRAAQAAAPLASAAELQEELLAQRLDGVGEGGARLQEERLHARAALELARAVAALAAGRAAGDRAVLEPLRLAHELGLEAQALAARGDGRELSHWDGVLVHELSPAGLLFTRPRPGWPLARSQDLRRELGAALASVAPREFPGFAPIGALSPELADPLDDPRRVRRLAAILDGRLFRVRRELLRLRSEVLERDGLEGLQEPGVSGRLRELLFERLEYERWKSDLAEHAHKLRTPTRLALDLAGDLLADGRALSARELAQALLADLEQEVGSELWAVELAAQTEMLIGSTWMQDDQPERAEEILASAVERYENLERTLLERGIDAALLVGLRRERAAALMSLAVNTNVRLRDPERALQFFERAYELRQDDFMRVLLACYRARMGRAAEARSLLGQIQVAPALYYNLACTHALLGDGQRALELLELDFATNHDSESSLEQQKRWAAEDPDLGSLRADPRFQWLVGEPAQEEQPEPR